MDALCFVAGIMLILIVCYCWCNMSFPQSGKVDSFYVPESRLEDIPPSLRRIEAEENKEYNYNNPYPPYAEHGANASADPTNWTDYVEDSVGHNTKARHKDWLNNVGNKITSQTASVSRGGWRETAGLNQQKNFGIYRWMKPTTNVKYQGHFQKTEGDNIQANHTYTNTFAKGLTNNASSSSPLFHKGEEDRQYGEYPLPDEQTYKAVLGDTSANQNLFS